MRRSVGMFRGTILGGADATVWGRMVSIAGKGVGMVGHAARLGSVSAMRHGSCLKQKNALVRRTQLAFPMLFAPSDLLSV